MNRIIIFGAGQIGRQALSKYAGRVDYFMDNNPEIQGTKIAGIEVKSVEEGVRVANGREIIIASKYGEMMSEQLSNLGIKEFVLFKGDSQVYYDTDELIFNPYLDNASRDVDEVTWNETVGGSHAIQLVNEAVERLYGKEELFSHVEIETINRCNGNCDFCPVSKTRDTREPAVMSRELFESIINQLAELEYSGKLALFSNNEPFLDSDILERHRYAREKLPKARMFLFTNGTLLDIEKFKQLMLYLDELVIDNYHQELQLIKPCREIVDYCEKHPELKRRVTIVLRKPREILSTRGGDAPNRKEMVSYGKARCVLPYKQLIVRPDGKVSLCCNDPLGKNTLADLTKESIMEAWNNQRFKTVREALYRGRENWIHCKFCDVFSEG